VGAALAEKLQQKFGTPYLVNPIPIGVTETNSFLKLVGATLGIEVAEVIAQKEERTYRSIEKGAVNLIEDVLSAIVAPL
jgi:nitrogenase molybdenum-iron protein alpha/beta subunit